MLTSPDALAEPLLTVIEEFDLAERIEAGVLARGVRLSGRDCRGATVEELFRVEERGERARQRYIRANLRLVAKLARQAAARSQLPESDLFQEGCLGLICAVERFDCRRGYKFSTYASFWVRAFLGAATANLLGALNLPVSRAGLLRQVRGMEVELAQSLGRSVSTGEMATALGRSEKWTADLMAHQTPTSFDGLDVDELIVGSSPWDDGTPSHDRPGAELLCHLHGIERDVLALRFGFTDGTAHTYVEVGRLLSVHVSKVRRIESRALEALRSVCPHSAYAHLSSGA